MSHEDSHVVTLKGKEQFESFIQKNKSVLVDFSTAWCHWCKVLAPEYKAAAEVFHHEKGDESTKTKLAYVDGDEDDNGSILKKYQVRGFPTLIYFQNGNVDAPQEYSGENNKDGIISWCAKRTLPAVTPIKSSEDFSNFIKTNTTGKNIAVVVWREGDATKDTVLKVVFELGDAHRDDFTVGHVGDSKVAKECSLSSALTLFRSFDTPIVTLNPKNLESVTNEELLGLIKAEKVPVLDEISQENANDYLSSTIPLVWIGAKLGTEKDQSDEKSGDIKKQITTRLTPIAEKFKGQLLFVLLNADVFPQQISKLGMSLPGIMIQGEESKYMFSGNFENTDEVKDFFNTWKEGKLSVYRRSQDPPATQDPDGAFVLVGSTIDDHVGKDKDAFVDFYADWCPPCQKMAPTYKELAHKFKGINGLMIAKIDADKNDTFQAIESYPTLFFFKKGSKEGIQYEGDRSLASFVEFVKTNATVDCSSVTV